MKSQMFHMLILVDSICKSKKCVKLLNFLLRKVNFISRYFFSVLHIHPSQIGIDPPRGVLMYGPPGCGKTMLAKAVAANTAASFIRVVGSEFVQKYLGEGSALLVFYIANCRPTYGPRCISPSKGEFSFHYFH